MADPYADFASPVGSYDSFSSPVKVAPAPSAAPAKRPVFDPLGDVVGATNAFMSGVKQHEQFNNRHNGRAPTLGEAAEDVVMGPVHTAQDALAAVSIPFAPMAGMAQRGLAEPYANVMSTILPGTKKEDWQNSMMTALSAAGPETGPTGMYKVPLGPPRPNAFAQTAARFDRAGVDPMAATVGGKGAASTTNVVAENPIAGARVRSGLRSRMEQTDASAKNIAGQYGETRGRQITGENVQAGVERFANGKDVAPPSAIAPAQASSFSAKASKLYDDVFSGLDAAMQGKTNPAETVQVFGHGDGPTTVQTGGSQIATPATTAALGDITNGGQSSALNALITDPTVSKAAKALGDAHAAKDMSFDDLRRVRTWVRTAQKNPELRQSIGEANLGRLEGALTQDIYQNADALGSPELSKQLRRTDQFYAAGQQRIQSALSSFTDAKSGEGAYSRIIQAAGSTGSADAQKLLSLKRSLSPDEWGDIAANAISELGAPPPGNAAAGGGGFSVNSFVTNYNKLSPRGRGVLFDSIGGGGKKAANLRAELDNLVSVADDLKQVEKGANTSKSFVNLQTAGTMTGLLTPHTTGPTAALLGSMALTGEMMTNPAVVRWLGRIASASKQGPKPLAGTIKQLGNAAKSNVVLFPLYQQAEPLMQTAPRTAISAAAQDQPQEGQ